MPPVASRRGAFVSYAAGLLVIAGLMAVVALGGNMVTGKRPGVEPSFMQITAQKQP